MTLTRERNILSIKDTIVAITHNENYFEDVIQATNSVYEMMAFILGETKDFSKDEIINAFEASIESPYTCGYKNAGKDVFQYDNDNMGIYNVITSNDLEASFQKPYSLVCYLILETDDLTVYFADGYAFTELNGIKTVYYFD